MVIDLVNTYVTGGAGFAARRLHDGLIRLGMDSRFWHRQPHEDVANDGTYRVVVWKPVWPGLWPRLFPAKARERREQWLTLNQRYLTDRPPPAELFTIPRRALPTPFNARAFEGAVLHLHWVADFLDYESFFGALPSSHPVVWTLHDQNPFTGGCHFDLGCRRFHQACGQCPQLAEPAPEDLSWEGLRIKRDALRGKNLHIVAPSRWIEEAARQSPIFREARSFHRIPYGLDTQTFAPQDRHEARRKLDLPENAAVVGFCADYIDSHRKGLHHLLSAFGRIQSPHRFMGLVFGGSNFPEGYTNLPEIRRLGFLRTPRDQAVAYSAMDMLVVPSLHDNLPQAGLEAMACGTPVVGFATGGIPDYVQHGETGLLARTGDEAELAARIQWLVERPYAATQMGRAARDTTIRQFGLETQARAYLDLYQHLQEERGRWRRKRVA